MKTGRDHETFLQNDNFLDKKAVGRIEKIKVYMDSAIRSFDASFLLSLALDDNHRVQDEDRRNPPSPRGDL